MSKLNKKNEEYLVGVLEGVGRKLNAKGLDVNGQLGVKVELGS